MPILQSAPGSSSIRLTALLLLAASLAIGWMGVRRLVPPAPDGVREPPPDARAAAFTEEGSEPVALEAGRICPSAGYLCAGLGPGDEIRLARWPDSAAPIRILVPAPEHEDAQLARALQRAAVRGILAWNRSPLDLDVRERSGGDPPDIRISWETLLPDRRLGEARTEWTRRGGHVTFRVTRFVLATRGPADPDLALEPGQVEAAAAHEMGHALGLPHSDSPSDLMFPSSTARRLTARDYATAQALYRLPNGVAVRAP